MKQIFSIAIIIVGTLIACDEKEITPTKSISPIIESDLPAAGLVDQEITFTVSHIVYNGCGHYASQKTTQKENTFFVTFFAQYSGNGICPLNIPTLKTPYTYTPKAAGVYTFKFKSEGEDYLTQTITIN